MKIREIKEWLDAEMLCGFENMDEEIEGVFASDFMSDILAFADNQKLLITGMVNPQVIRTAEMMDMRCIVFVRGKSPTDEIIALAKECGIIVMVCKYLMYSACGVLYSHEKDPKPCRI